MKTEIVSCLCCDSGVQIEAGCNSLGVKSERSGYEPVLLIDTSVAWICPGCVAKIAPHVQAIVDLLHNDDVFWNGLPHLVARKKTDLGGGPSA